MSPFPHRTDYFLDVMDSQQVAMRSFIHRYGSEIGAILSEYRETFSDPYIRSDAFNCNCSSLNPSLSWLFRGEDLFMPRRCIIF